MSQKYSKKNLIPDINISMIPSCYLSEVFKKLLKMIKKGLSIFFGLGYFLFHLEC